MSMYVQIFISPIYLSVIFSNSLAVRSHSPSDNGFIVRYVECVRSQERINGQNVDFFGGDLD